MVKLMDCWLERMREKLKLKAEKMGLNWAGWKGPKKVCRMGLKKVHQTEMCLGLWKVDLTVCQMGLKMGKQKAWQTVVHWAGWKELKKVPQMGLKKEPRMGLKKVHQTERGLGLWKVDLSV